MEKKNIAVLFGGASPEYPISLQSAHAVITHVDAEKYTPVLVGIARQGQWLRFLGDAQHILDDTWHQPQHCTKAFISPCRTYGGLVEWDTAAPTHTKLDAAFPVMHGAFGEDGTVQGLLELAGIPIVGCGTLSSALCMDKDIAHRLVAGAGIGVPRSAVLAAGTPVEEALATAAALGYPLFVKPARAGSSFGVSRVANAAGLAAAVQEAFQYDGRVLLEEAIQGFEVGCAVMGDKTLIIGELDEVELSNGFFNFTEKYNLTTSHIHVPARIPEEKTAEIKQAAAIIYRLLQCSGFARIDFFLTPDGRIVFNEANTIPGFTTHSRYPTMMKAIGLDFGTMVNRLIEQAVTA